MLIKKLNLKCIYVILTLGRLQTWDTAMFQHLGQEIIGFWRTYLDKTYGCGNPKTHQNLPILKIIVKIYT